MIGHGEKLTRNCLARLEKAAAATRVVVKEAQDRAEADREERDAAWAIMQRTMSDEHARMVVEAYAASAQDIKSPEYKTPAGRLLRRCLDAMDRLKYRHWPYTEIATEVVLAMPPPVAEVYLNHDALPLHECEDCGFAIPVTSGEYKGRAAVRHFDVCPLCGERVGWYAYFNRRKAEADAGSGHTIQP